MTNSAGFLAPGDAAAAMSPAREQEDEEPSRLSSVDMFGSPGTLMALREPWQQKTPASRGTYLARAAHSLEWGLWRFQNSLRSWRLDSPRARFWTEYLLVFKIFETGVTTEGQGHMSCMNLSTGSAGNIVDKPRSQEVGLV